MSQRVWTIPNLLTFFRLTFLPFFVVIALHSPMTGAILAAALGATDFLDGWIARRFNQESELGRILDPISDRALVLVSFIVFIIVGALPLWYVLTVGFREILITLGTIIVFFSKRVRLDINMMGKISAFAAMTATPCWVLQFETHGGVSDFWLGLAVIGSIISIPLGYFSLVQYYQAYAKA